MENSTSDENQIIAVRSSPVHGNGVFARKEIAAGTLVCEYKGEIIGAAEMEKRDAARRESSPLAPIFFFQIDEENFIDATNCIAGNAARFINHSCEENCEARWNAVAKRMEIFAIVNIAAGEELFLDYGFELAGFFERPCRCGSKNCCGFVVVKILRPELRKKLARFRRSRRGHETPH